MFDCRFIDSKRAVNERALLDWFLMKEVDSASNSHRADKNLFEEPIASWERVTTTVERMKPQEGGDCSLSASARQGLGCRRSHVYDEDNQLPQHRQIWM